VSTHRREGALCARAARGRDRLDLLNELRIARVAADPELVAPAASPGGWPGLVYYRLHGSPRTYYSAYPEASIRSLGASLLPVVRRATVWCIFDNTAAGAAAADAVAMTQALQRGGGA
jgi:uncharacterized protein YecE (DUF72 family)